MCLLWPFNSPFITEQLVWLCRKKCRDRTSCLHAFWDLTPCHSPAGPHSEHLLSWIPPPPPCLPLLSPAKPPSTHTLEYVETVPTSRLHFCRNPEGSFPPPSNGWPHSHLSDDHGIPSWSTSLPVTSFPSSHLLPFKVTAIKHLLAL